MSDRVADIEGRLAKATPGPWIHEESRGYVIHERIDGWRKVVAQSGLIGDADLIANAPADLAWLLAELAKARQKLAALPERIALAIETRPFGFLTPNIVARSFVPTATPESGASE